MEGDLLLRSRLSKVFNTLDQPFSCNHPNPQTNQLAIEMSKRGRSEEKGCERKRGCYNPEPNLDAEAPAPKCCLVGSDDFNEEIVLSSPTGFVNVTPPGEKKLDELRSQVLSSVGDYDYDPPAFAYPLWKPEDQPRDVVCLTRTVVFKGGEAAQPQSVQTSHYLVSAKNVVLAKFYSGPVDLAHLCACGHSYADMEKMGTDAEIICPNKGCRKLLWLNNLVNPVHRVHAQVYGSIVNHHAAVTHWNEVCAPRMRIDIDGTTVIERFKCAAQIYLYFKRDRVAFFSPETAVKYTTDDLSPCFAV